MINKRSAAICGAAEVQRVTENAPSWPEVNTPIIGHGVGGYMDARRPTSVPITVVFKLLWKKLSSFARCNASENRQAKHSGVSSVEFVGDRGEVWFIFREQVQIVI
jgi:hypothetical protein